MSEIAQDDNSLILSLTESHLTPNIKDAEIKIENYTSFRTDRSDQRRKGGVITYIKNTVAGGTKVLLSVSNSYTEVQILKVTSINMVLITIYRPPACPTGKFVDQLTKVNELLNDLPSPIPTLVLTGDLNFPQMDWDSESVYGGAEDMRFQAEALLRLMRDFCLNQLINIPTRGDSILDVVMTNNDELIYNFTVNKTNLSDHNIITVTTTIATTTTTDHKSSGSTASKSADVNFNKLNFLSKSVPWDEFKKEIDKVDWTKLLHDTDPVIQYDIIHKTCLDISGKFVPTRKPIKKKIIPRDRKILMRKRTKLRKKLRYTTSDTNVHRIEANITTIEDKLKASVVAENMRKEIQAVSCIKTNPKYFYTYASNKTNVRTGVGPLTTTTGKFIYEPEVIADLLRQQYESVFSHPHHEKVIKNPNEFFSKVLTPNITDISFNMDDIVNAIKEVGISAAAGPDQFPAALLKNCAKELSEPLHILFRNSLDTGIIPQQLKSAKITPVYKGGSKGEAKNYRPIALTSHIIKIMEKIIVKSMSIYLEENNILNNDQHGFRVGRSCLSQLLSHHEKILIGLENKKDMDVIYLDFAKAFDKVDHGILLHKLRDSGISGKLGKWLHCFLVNRQQSVAVSGVVSKPSIVTSGVPQGSVLGPLLFLLHISDINKLVKYSTVSSFADDTRILKEVSTTADADLLKKDLSAIYLWAEQNNMSFNSSKFEHINYGKDQLNVHTYSAHDGSTIESKRQVLDLGVTLSRDGSFTLHITNITKKARKQAGWILRTFRTRDITPMLTLYKSLIIPLLEYCCQLWSPWRVGEIQLLESVQRSFTSKITSASHLDYWERLKLLKLFSLERRRERYAIIYIFKILRGHTTNNLSISFQYHQRLGRLCNVRRPNPRATTRVKTLKENAFATRGPLIFNALPKYLRDTNETCPEKFKNQLDKFLWTIPDQPKMPHYYHQAASNSIVDQLAQKRAEGFFF